MRKTEKEKGNSGECSGTGTFLEVVANGRVEEQNGLGELDLCARVQPVVDVVVFRFLVWFK